MDLLADQQAMGEEQACLDIPRFEERVVLKQVLDCLSSREIAQNMLHGYPHASDDRLSAEDVGSERDAVEQLILLSHGILLRFLRRQFEFP